VIGLFWCSASGFAACSSNYTFSSSFLRAKTAFSLSATSSSKYWYLSFFLALHSLALCRLRSTKYNGPYFIIIYFKKITLFTAYPIWLSCQLYRPIFCPVCVPAFLIPYGEGPPKITNSFIQ
jgi:hypothetical protein